MNSVHHVEAMHGSLVVVPDISHHRTAAASSAMDLLDLSVEGAVQAARDNGSEQLIFLRRASVEKREVDIVVM